MARNQNEQRECRKYLMKPEGILKCDQNEHSEFRKYLMNRPGF